MGVMTVVAYAKRSAAVPVHRQAVQAKTTLKSSMPVRCRHESDMRNGYFRCVLKARRKRLAVPLDERSGERSLLRIVPDRRSPQSRRAHYLHPLPEVVSLSFCQYTA
jgi:hypothetical protein